MAMAATTSMNAAAMRVRGQDFSNFTRVWIGNVTTGQSHETIFDESLTLMGISPNGRRVALRSGGWELGSNWGQLQHLYIGEVSGSGITVNRAYNPFATVGSARAGSSNRDGDIEWVGLVSDSRVLVLSARGQLVLLNVDNGRPEWQWSLGGSGRVYLSPGGRYAIAAGASDVFLFQTADGEGIGQFDNSSVRGVSREFAFSPDGRTIASSGLNRIALWDATTGQVHEPFYIGDGGVGNLQWLDNRYLMAGSRLVDTETKSVLWNYSHGANARAIGGNYWFSTSAGNMMRVVPVVLPHPQALLVAESDTSLFSIAPGLSAVLHLDDSVQNGRAAIQQGMERKFAENGWNLATHAPVTITLKVITEPEATASYHVSRTPAPIPIPRMMGGGDGTEVKFTPRRAVIEVREGDKLVWTSSHTQRAPSQISMSEIQHMSLQEVVNQHMAQTQYRDWFLNARIPRTIPNPDRAGRSRLTENGIQ